MARPLPLPDVDSLPYWQAAKAHRLSLPKCGDCGRISFPPRPVCPNCLSRNLAWQDLSGNGLIYSYCVMHDAKAAPYVIAQVELAEQAGLRLTTTNILECPPEAVHVGMAVEVTFEDIDAQISMPQFRPLKR